MGVVVGVAAKFANETLARNLHVEPAHCALRSLILSRTPWLNQTTAE